MSRFESVEALLADARAGLSRADVAQAQRLRASGWGLVDIRPAWQRVEEGEIEGALIVERNHLEWRLHPASPARLPIANEIQQWIVFCSEGYTSSLAAAALNSLGIDATDVIGGIRAWRDAGAPVLHGLTAADAVVSAGSASGTQSGKVFLGAPETKLELHP